MTYQLIPNIKELVVNYYSLSKENEEIAKIIEPKQEIVIVNPEQKIQNIQKNDILKKVEPVQEITKNNSNKELDSEKSYLVMNMKEVIEDRKFFYPEEEIHLVRPKNITPRNDDLNSLLNDSGSISGSYKSIKFEEPILIQKEKDNVDIDDNNNGDIDVIDTIDDLALSPIQKEEPILIQKEKDNVDIDDLALSPIQQRESETEKIKENIASPNPQTELKIKTSELSEPDWAETSGAFSHNISFYSNPSYFDDHWRNRILSPSPNGIHTRRLASEKRTSLDLANKISSQLLEDLDEDGTFKDLNYHSEKIVPAGEGVKLKITLDIKPIQKGGQVSADVKPDTSQKDKVNTRVITATVLNLDESVKNINSQYKFKKSRAQKLSTLPSINEDFSNDNLENTEFVEITGSGELDMNNDSLIKVLEINNVKRENFSSQSMLNEPNSKLDKMKGVFRSIPETTVKMQRQDSQELFNQLADFMPPVSQNNKALEKNDAITITDEIMSSKIDLTHNLSETTSEGEFSKKSTVNINEEIVGSNEMLFKVDKEHLSNSAHDLIKDIDQDTDQIILNSADISNELALKEFEIEESTLTEEGKAIIHVIPLLVQTMRDTFKKVKAEYMQKEIYEIEEATRKSLDEFTHKKIKEYFNDPDYNFYANMARRSFGHVLDEGLEKIQPDIMEFGFVSHILHDYMIDQISKNYAKTNINSEHLITEILTAMVDKLNTETGINISMKELNSGVLFDDRSFQQIFTNFQLSLEYLMTNSVMESLIAKNFLIKAKEIANTYTKLFKESKQNKDFKILDDEGVDLMRLLRYQTIMGNMEAQSVIQRVEVPLFIWKSLGRLLL